MILYPTGLKLRTVQFMHDQKSSSSRPTMIPKYSKIMLPPFSASPVAVYQITKSNPST